MDSTELGVGVVGGGWAGQNAATQIAKVDRARLVGVSDIDPDAARKLADQCDAQQPECAEKSRLMIIAHAARYFSCRPVMPAVKNSC